MDKLEKKKKYLKTAKIVMIVFLIIFILSVIASIFQSMNLKYKEPEQFDMDNAVYGEYMTADLVYIAPLYELYSEEGTEEKTDSYYCLALDTKYNMFIAKVDYSYYIEQLKMIEDVEIDLNNLSDNDSVTVYGLVQSIDTDIQNALAEDYESQFLLTIPTNYQIELLSSPAYEDNDALLPAISMGICFVFAMIIFVKVKNKYDEAIMNYNDYGDVESIYQEIVQNCIYADNSIKVSYDYIISIKDHNKLVRLSEVLCLYVTVQRVNGMRTGVILSAVNKYGESIGFQYGIGGKKKVEELIIRLKELCPRAVLGYSAQNMDYISKNKLSRVR